MPKSFKYFLLNQLYYIGLVIFLSQCKRANPAASNHQQFSPVSNQPSVENNEAHSPKSAKPGLENPTNTSVLPAREIDTQQVLPAITNTGNLDRSESKSGMVTPDQGIVPNNLEGAGISNFDSSTKSTTDVSQLPSTQETLMVEPKSMADESDEIHSLFVPSEASVGAPHASIHKNQELSVEIPVVDASLSVGFPAEDITSVDTPTEEMLEKVQEDPNLQGLYVTLKHLQKKEPVDINQRFSGKLRKATALHEAVILGDPTIVALLLKKSADRELKDGFQHWTPLEHAKHHLNLLQREADILQELNPQSSIQSNASKAVAGKKRVCKKSQAHYQKIIQLLENI